MKHNLVYKITNLINGNYYIGKHSDESIKKGIQTRKQRGNLKRSKESIEKQKTTRLLKNISYATTTNCKWYNDGTNEKLFKMDE
jgi:hypothetical protein